MNIQTKLFILFIPLIFMGCSNETDLASVNGHAVSQSEFDSYLTTKRIDSKDDAQTKRILALLVERMALATAAENSSLIKSAEIKAEVDAFKRQLVISKYFKTYLKDAVTDQAIQNYYVNNADRYSAEKIHVAHILFRVTPKMDESERQALATTAQQAYSKLRAGESFSDLAKALSGDKVSAVKGGDLGWIAKGAVSEEFSAIAFGLKKGDVSEPLLTAFGFHIISVLDDAQTTKKPLEAVRGEIRYQLRKNAKDAETERLTNTIKHKIY